MRRIGHIQRDGRMARAPSIECRPDGVGQNLVPVPDIGQTFLVQDHRQAFAQPEQVMRGRGAVPVMPELGRIGAGGPVPIGCVSMISGVPLANMRIAYSWL